MGHDGKSGEQMLYFSIISNFNMAAMAGGDRGGSSLVYNLPWQPFELCKIINCVCF